MEAGRKWNQRRKTEFNCDDGRTLDTKLLTAKHDEHDLTISCCCVQSHAASTSRGNEARLVFHLQENVPVCWSASRHWYWYCATTATEEPSEEPEAPGAGDSQPATHTRSASLPGVCRVVNSSHKKLMLSLGFAEVCLCPLQHFVLFRGFGAPASLQFDRVKLWVVLDV